MVSLPHAQIRIWRNAHLPKEHELASAFAAFPRLSRSVGGSAPGLVLDWQQRTGHILSGGAIDVVRVWDADREQCVIELPLAAQAYLPATLQPPQQQQYTTNGGGQQSFTSPLLAPNSMGAIPSSFTLPSSALAGGIGPGGAGGTTTTAGAGNSSGGGHFNLQSHSLASSSDGALFAAGCNDGSLRVFDIRQPAPLVTTLLEHRAAVVKCHFQAGPSSAGLLVSGGASGDVVLTDLRHGADSIVKIAAHSNSDLNALAVHDHAPLIASGSHKQFIKVFNTSGEPLSMIRYHDGFLGQRIGPVACLAFHPHKLLLAAGALDSYISIYAGS